MANEVNLRICLAISIFLPALAGLTQAATITVGSGTDYDFNTIQTGIDAAVDGDTVLVAPGEYVITEPVTFRGKSITVKSEAGRDETTIRMGTPTDSKRGSVFIFENNETASSVVDGFTITGGKGCWVAEAEGLVGGGIYFTASSATVRNCKILHNNACGVLCELQSSPTLIDCIIAENSTEDLSIDNGGGVMVVVGASMTLTKCIITGNSSRYQAGGIGCWSNSAATLSDCIIAENASGLSGGGMMTWDNCCITMTDCIVMGNTAGGGLGGGMQFTNSLVTLTNCVIAHNTAALGGGGIGCSGADSSLSIRNCTIWGNSGGSNYGGGGVGCFSGCSAEITNSIILGNTSAKGQQIALTHGASKLTVNFSNIAGGQAGIHIQGGSTLDWVVGNTDAEPLFADPNNGDFHLKSKAGRWDPNSQTWILDNETSPCIDAGDPNSDWIAELWPHGERINMGAYGGTSQASRSLSDAGNVADLNRDGIVDSADMRIMVDHWGTDEPLCDIGPMPWGDGIVDVQDLIVLAEHLFEEVPPIE